MSWWNHSHPHRRMKLGLLIIERDSLTRVKRFIEDVVNTNSLSEVKEKALNEKRVFIIFVYYSFFYCYSQLFPHLFYTCNFPIRTKAMEQLIKMRLAFFFFFFSHVKNATFLQFNS